MLSGAVSKVSKKVFSQIIASFGDIKAFEIDEPSY
jgi:hypothetical protein